MPSPKASIHPISCQKPHNVYLGIGSNIEPERNIQQGLNELSLLFGRLTLSSTYQSAAVGFYGPDFYNLVAHFETEMSLADLVRTLKTIEIRFGRTDFSDKFSSRVLDLDVLLFDDYRGNFDRTVLPRPEIRYNAHVLCPFAELAPELQLPGDFLTLQTLWQCFNNPSQTIRQTDIVWQVGSDLAIRAKG